MQHAKFSFSDLQFIFQPRACYTKDIQKTFIFVNTIGEILLVIEVIRKQIELLNYLKKSQK